MSKLVVNTIENIAGASPYAPTLGTEITANSASEDFIDIPSSVRRIFVMFETVVAGDTSNFIIQIGDSGGIEATGYSSHAWNMDNTLSTFTNGFGLSDSQVAARVNTGVAMLFLSDSANNTWICTSQLIGTSGAYGGATGYKSLSSTLDRLRVTTASGSTAFSSGSINIQYE